MLLGVVSDTHNNIANVEKIIVIFNANEVDCVIHTGDITQAKTLEKFCKLNCPLIAVFGNNDLKEIGLKRTSEKYGFDLQNPPLFKTIGNKNIVILHEPYEVKELIREHQDLDLILHGHTHKYTDNEEEGVRIFNPGECAGMLEGKNAIGLIELDQLKIRRIFF